MFNKDALGLTSRAGSIDYIRKVSRDDYMGGGILWASANLIAIAIEADYFRPGPRQLAL